MSVALPAPNGTTTLIGFEGIFVLRLGGVDETTAAQGQTELFHFGIDPPLVSRMRCSA